MANNFFEEFPFTTPEQWESALSSALKGQSPDEKLTFFDPIEALTFKAHYHPQTEARDSGTPGSYPYTRGGKYNSNEWEIVTLIPIADAVQMNANALEWLMKGATSLRLDLQQFDPTDCARLVENIGLNHIITTFIYHTEEQWNWIQSLLNSETKWRIHAYSPIHRDSSEGIRSILIDGSEVTKCGGNATQEITYLLHRGHEALYHLLHQGIAIDDAASRLKFRIGVTGNYFIQIAKQRAFRSLWSQLVHAYHPEYSCSQIAYCEAETIFLNKSVKDPYTNLLRQTTEAMSAVAGGIDELTILPFDWKNTHSDWQRTNRLAINISLILKEESYFAKVCDPVGGAYSLEYLTETLSDSSWKLFQHTEKAGLSDLQLAIQTTSTLRLQHFSEGTNTLIGVNTFKNPQDITGEWQSPEVFSIGKELIIERDLHLTTQP